MAITLGGSIVKWEAGTIIQISMSAALITKKKKKKKQCSCYNYSHNVFSILIAAGVYFTHVFALRYISKQQECGIELVVEVRLY